MVLLYYLFTIVLELYCVFLLVMRLHLVCVLFMQLQNVIGKLLDVWNIYMRALSLFMLNLYLSKYSIRACLPSTKPFADGSSVGICIDLLFFFKKYYLLINKYKNGKYHLPTA